MMLKKGEEYSATPKRVEVVVLLKRSLLQAPVLVTPDWNKDFHVFVDVSGFCIGLVLSQLDENGRDHPIYFASRQLALAECQYSPTD